MPTILVVDDSAIERRLAGSMLERHLNCEVIYAADGKEALAQLEVALPDVLVTDLQMPEMNGLELVAAVKSDFPTVPVVLMTAVGSEDIAAEALRRGAASYVPKRRLAEDLAATVERVLLASRQDRVYTRLMHYLDSCDAAFTLRNDLGLGKALVNHVQETLRSLPLGDETERLRVSVALEEAIKNAYYHGNLEIGQVLGQADRKACDQLAQERLDQPPYQGRRIHVRARITREKAVFTVRDDGPGFNASSFLSAVGPAAESGAGRGITLMCSIMDEVTYNTRGNEVTLVKRRAVEPPAPADDDDSSR